MYCATKVKTGGIVIKRFAAFSGGAMVLPKDPCGDSLLMPRATGDQQVRGNHPPVQSFIGAFDLDIQVCLLLTTSPLRLMVYTRLCCDD